MSRSRQRRDLTLHAIPAARLAGAWADRVGATSVVLAGPALAGAAATVAAFTLTDTLVTLVCLALFDAGLFAAQVANQSTVLSIDPAAPARFNSAYMLVYFVGGSLGSAAGAAAVDRFGWAATASLAAAAVGIAATIVVITSVRHSRATGGYPVTRTGRLGGADAPGPTDTRPVRP
ncbi:hypothetical protein [Nocardia sp. NPDC002869]|uniref:hypothetical protein n=1 Tax=Nocardia sp. NPDC002869 TaxID=3161032 RepID=UPI00398D292E